MNKCPKCGYEWPDDKCAAGGKARWEGVPKAKSKAIAQKAAEAR